MKIIGVAGTNGSGKDTIGVMLQEKYKFLFVSASDILRQEARARGQESTREILRNISAEWRRELGSLGALIDKVVDLYKQVEDQYPGGLAIVSLRNPGEPDRIHELGGTMVWVDADQEIRYNRIQSNSVSRGRAGEDNKTFEQFLAEEAAEMHHEGDAATLNMSAVKERSDVFITNDGDDIEAFKSEAERILRLKSII
jgi:dephospho-CoA kinase